MVWKISRSVLKTSAYILNKQESKQKRAKTVKCREEEETSFSEVKINFSNVLNE